MTLIVWTTVALKYSTELHMTKLNIRLPPDVESNLLNFCKAHDLSKSAVTRMAIRKLLKEEEMDMKLPFTAADLLDLKRGGDCKSV